MNVNKASYALAGAITDAKDMAKPKMAKHRYSREEMYAIMETVELDDGPPSLMQEFNDFVLSEPQRPVTLSQMNEHEEVIFAWA